MELGALFSCNQCYFKSKQQSDLDNHKLLHPVKKSYSCEECSYKSAWSSYLDDHISSVHSLKKKNRIASLSMDSDSDIGSVKHQIKEDIKKTYTSAHIKYKKVERNNDFEEVLKDIEYLFGKHDTQKDNCTKTSALLTSSNVRCGIDIDEMNVKMEVKEYVARKNVLEGNDLLQISNMKKERDIEQQLFVDKYDIIEFSKVDTRKKKKGRRSDFDEVMEDIAYLFSRPGKQKNIKPSTYRINENVKLENMSVHLPRDAGFDGTETYDNTLFKVEDKEQMAVQNVQDGEGMIEISNIKKEIDIEQDLEDDMTNLKKEIDVGDRLEIDSSDIKEEVNAEHKLNVYVSNVKEEVDFERDLNINILNIKKEIDDRQDLEIDRHDRAETRIAEIRAEIDEDATFISDGEKDEINIISDYKTDIVDTELTAICKNIDGKFVTLYRCPVCKCEFKSLMTYDEHVKACHSEIIHSNLIALKIHREDKVACDFCKVICTNSQKLKAHVKVEHRDNYLSCDICNFSCKSSLTLKEHKTKHKVYYCCSCPSRFTKYDEFICHRKQHPKHSCEYCHVEYSRLTSLVKHEEKCKKDDIGEKVPKPVIKCEKCEFKTDSKNTMKFHVRQFHKGQKVFICEICKYKCLREVSMVYHKMKHNGIKPYCCDKCSYRCSNTLLLTKHRLTHRDSLVCKICNAKFKSTRFFNKHMLIHNKDQPFVCKVCNIPFKTKQYLKYHSNIHNDIMRFSCKKCNFKCKRRSQLNEHTMAHHDKTYFTCKSCNVVYKTIKHFKTHMLSHKNLEKKLKDTEINI